VERLSENIVVKAGKNVKDFSEGDRVTVLGGPYSEYFEVKASSAVKVPGNIKLETVLGEPVACFMHAAKRFGIKKGERIAVIGCGFMGLGCLQLAKREGAGEIIALEPIEWRRKKALECGADKAINPSGLSPDAILRNFGEFDVIIEATGIQEAIDVSSVLVREHGRIILIGYHQSNDGIRSVDMRQWNYKAIDIINGHVRREDEKLDAMREAVSLEADGLLKMENLVSVYEFSDIEEAFKDLISRKENLFKAVLKLS